MVKIFRWPDRIKQKTVNQICPDANTLTMTIKFWWVCVRVCDVYHVKNITLKCKHVMSLLDDSEHKVQLR